MSIPSIQLKRSHGASIPGTNEKHAVMTVPTAPRIRIPVQSSKRVLFLFFRAVRRLILTIRRSPALRNAHRITVYILKARNGTDKKEQYGYPFCPKTPVQIIPQSPHSAYRHEKEQSKLKEHGQSTDHFAVFMLFHNEKIIS